MVLLLHKTCSKCRQSKVASDFHCDPTTTSGLTAQCKPCKKALRHSHYQNNKPKTLKQTKAYRDSHSIQSKISSRARYLKNKAQRVAYCALARAAKLHASPQWLSDSQKRDMRIIYATANKLGHHVDHIIPLHGQNICGLHVPWNLQTLSPLENLRKGNKW